MGRIRLCTVTGFFALLALMISPAARAQNDTWIGSGGNDLWTNTANWGLGTLPTSANVAYFNGTGAGETTIDLSGTTQTMGALQFDTGAAGYTIGVSSGDTLDIANASNGSAGAISVTSGVTNAQAINAAIAFTNVAPTVTDASGTAGLTLGSSGSPSTITTTTGTTSLTFTASGGSTITLNDVITGPVGGVISGSTATGGLSLQTASGTAPTGIIALDAQNTYTGVTNLNATSGFLTVQVGASTDTASSATYTKGPFGVGTIAFNGSGTQSFIQAVGADQTVANPITIIGGNTFNNAPTAHSLAFTGPVNFVGPNRTLTFSNSSTTPMTFTFGSSSSPSTISLNTSTAVSLAFDAAQFTTLVLNDVIQNTGAGTDTIAFNSASNTTPQGVVLITGANTYSGTTTLAGQTSGTLLAQTTQIGVSSVGAPGSITSGPFGKGTLITNGNASAPPILEPFGADQTVANAITMTSGFLVNNPTSAQDPSGAHNLTFTGPITNSAGKTLTNNLAVAVALTLGSSGSPSTISMTSGMTFQNNAGTDSTTIINDLISGTTLTAKTNGTYYVNNGSNSYTGGTTVIGLGTTSAAAGTGATIAGTGKLGASGTVTISSTTSGQYGGIVSPGNGSSPGTLNVPSMAWDRYGQYTFEYNPSSTLTGNDLINGSGSLTLADLSNGDFNINLVPANANTPLSGPQTYELAVFDTGVTGTANLSDFTFSGTYNMASTPTVTTAPDAGNSSFTDVLLTFTPAATPEPTSLALTGLAGAGLLGRRRKRRI